MGFVISKISSYFGLGTFRLYLVHLRNHERLKSCTEDLNINLRSPRHTIHEYQCYFFTCGGGGGEVKQTTFHYETMQYTEIFSSVRNENFMRKNDILKF